MELDQTAVISGAKSRQEAARALPRLRTSAHGLDNRGLEGAALGAGFGRFGRMFSPKGRGLTEACLQAVAEAMIKIDKGVPIDVPEPVDENSGIPAGYTYFGQFVDHDITLDTTSLSARGVDVAAIVDFRTPALDLDCVYGRGPDDQPYLYESDGLTLRLGDKLAPVPSGKTANTRDVLRLSDPNAMPPLPGRGDRPAMLGDKRNDENRLVVQIQSAFIAFHNKVVHDRALIEAFHGDWSDPSSRFATALDIVRWHYQWLVLHDYLERVLQPGAVAEVWRDGRPDIVHYDADGGRGPAYMPVEFAGAAYRFGHSMVRPGYALNGQVGADTTKGTTGDENTSPQPPFRVPLFSDVDNDPTQNLNGFGFPLPASWGIDWAFFFDGPERGEIPEGFLLPQPSYRIDAQLVDPLQSLPEFQVQGGILRNLAFRNLVRGTANLRLPSGEQIANILRVPVLPPEILWSAGSKDAYDQDKKGKWTRKGDAKLKKLAAAGFEDLEKTHNARQGVADKFVKGKDQSLRGNTPLWYYILREGEFYGTGRVKTDPLPVFGGQHLGPVGSRIVAETFVGLLWRDQTSFLRRIPDFVPHPAIVGSDKVFTLASLLKFALG